MTKSKLSISVCSAALLSLAACASEPKTDANLDAAHTAVGAAASNPSIAEYASLELQHAKDALAQSEQAWATHDTVATDHYAYLAQRDVDLAQQTATLKSEQAEVANGSAERAKILAARRGEEASQAQAALSAQQQQTEQTRSQLNQTQAQLQQQAQQTQAAQAEAQAARQQADTLRQQLALLQQNQAKQGVVLTLGDVLFSVNSATLKPGAYHSIDQIADFLNKHPERTVKIEGFTDSTGSEDYNMQLSKGRADSVKDALMDQGVAADRITARGRGESDPVASNATAVGRQMNRRVEVAISDQQGHQQIGLR